MSNLKGNPNFTAKYSESTKVVRLPESLANAISSALDSGLAPADLLDAIAKLAPHSASATSLAASDLTSIKLALSVGLLTSIKIAAKEQSIHYLDWIIDQCRKGLNAPIIPEEMLKNLIENTLEERLTELNSRLALLEKNNESTPQDDNKKKLSESLSRIELAKRLQISKDALRVKERRSRENPEAFYRYCRKHDPENYAWKLDLNLGKYICLG